MAGDQRQHDRRLIVVIKVGPVHSHFDTLAVTDRIRHPPHEQLLDLDALIGQQPIHLFDRVLFELTFRSS